MQLYEELFYCIGELYRAFSNDRTTEAWMADILPTLRDWIMVKGSSGPVVCWRDSDTIIFTCVYCC